MKKKTRIVTLLLVCVMLCGMLAMTTFAVSKTGRKTINGNTLTCTITYFGSSSYESGELDVYANGAEAQRK